MAQAQSTVRRRRGDLLAIPWSQRKPEEFVASEASQMIFQLKSGPDAGMWKARIHQPKPEGKPRPSPKNLGPVPYSRIDELIARRDAELEKIRTGKELTHGREAKAMTLIDWKPKYLDIVAKVNGREGSTVDNYDYALDFVCSTKGYGIGYIELAHMERTDITGWMAAARTAGHSIEWVNEGLRRLKGCLNEAVRNKKLTGLATSPAADIKPIENKNKGNALENYVTDELNAGRLRLAAYEVIKGQRELSYMAALPIVGTDCGLRRSELVALRWGDVHLDVPQPYIDLRQHASVSGKGKKRRYYFVRGTKASEGRPETVVLTKRAVAALRAAKKALLEHKMRLGRRWKAGHVDDVLLISGTGYLIPSNPVADDALVFPSPRDGGVYKPDTLATWFKRTLCERAGITTMSIHSLRHDCASIMIAKGYPLPVVANHMRHANSAITATTYAHLLKNQEASTTAAFDSIPLEEEGRQAV